MMPCKLCSRLLSAGTGERGLKQVGKTKYVGQSYARRYRCQDCSAEVVVTGEVSETREVWAPPPIAH
jgi:hypothetical protein